MDNNENNTNPRAYIVNFWYEQIKYRAWFIGEDSPEKEADMKNAIAGLDEVKAECSSGEEFFNAAVQHIQKYGFMRVKE